jgi:peroxiredoxin
MKSLDENFAAFKKLNTVPFGIGVDSSPCNNAWAKSLGIKHLPLLADFWPHGTVAQAYSVFRSDEGVSERTNVIIGEDGRVIFKKIYPDEVQPDTQEILDFLSGKAATGHTPGKQECTL